jgi:hypothetical protein
MYIGGDSGKIVTITHLTRNKNAGPQYPNVEISREVTIPYTEYIGTSCWSSKPCEDVYIRVSTDGSTEARIILGDILLRGGFCNSYEIIERPADWVFWDADSIKECMHCNICRYTQTWPIDSLYAYFEEVKYPGYKVVRKGESYGEVNEADLVGWKNPYQLSDSARHAKYEDYYQLSDSAFYAKYGDY